MKLSCLPWYVIFMVQVQATSKIFMFTVQWWHICATCSMLFPLMFPEEWNNILKQNKILNSIIPACWKFLPKWDSWIWEGFKLWPINFQFCFNILFNREGSTPMPYSFFAKWQGIGQTVMMHFWVFLPKFWIPQNAMICCNIEGLLFFQELAYQMGEIQYVTY